MSRFGARSSRVLVLGAILALAACAYGRPKNPEEAACRREAYNDPRVKALLPLTAPGAYNYIQNTEPTTPEVQLQQALRQATLECMRRRGYAGGGGVEPIQPSPFAF